MARALASQGAGVVFVGAHPDDESYALGGHLPRLPEAQVVIITDGAPRDLRDAIKVGFETAAQYASARHAELIDALAEAGIGPDQLTTLDVPDQQAVYHLPEIVRRLAAILADSHCWLVLTHAYEGGHPDHDAAACAVHAACAMLRRQGIEPPVIVEMPYYRVDDGGGVVQAFTPAPDAPVHLVTVDEHSHALKQRMMGRHASQARLFGGSGLLSPIEQFRVAPDYDFRRLPNDGRLLYERWRLGVTGAQWLEAAQAAREALGLTP
jgi:LmbE family N-acetylglucosaminyl deacetylase